MKNLFTFGCSHTNHNYPTWANILGEQYENHYNLGRGGTGVFFSFYQIVNVIQNREKWNITEDDAFVWLVTEENRQDFIMHSEPLSLGGFDWWTDNWYNNSQNWWTENYEKNMSSMDGLTKAHTHIYTIKELLEKYNIKHKIILALHGSGYPASVNYDEYKKNINKIVGEYTDLQSIASSYPKDERHYYFLEDGKEKIDGHFQIPIHIKFLHKNIDWFEEKNIEKYIQIHNKCKSKRYSGHEIDKVVWGERNEVAYPPRWMDVEL